ncbi:PAS domain S-box protein [Sedimenticola selenatireducens]|nr:PAS domain S-box protein [Sedimenticola selenatireducens]
MHNFGKRLTSILDKSPITITDIAKALGVSRQAVYKWIKFGGITDDNTNKLAELLEVNPAWLRFGIDGPSVRNRENDSSDKWDIARGALIERLIKSEHSLRVTHDIAKVATWEYSLANDRVTFSDRMQRHFGLPLANEQPYSRKQFLELIHPDDREAFKKNLVDLILGAPENQSEIRLILPDESILWATAWTIRNEDANHQCLGLFGALQNITDRKQAECALRMSQQNLVEAQRIAHLGSWEWTIADDTARWSDEMYRIFGVEKEHYTPSYPSFLNMLEPTDRDDLIQCLGNPRNSNDNEKTRREFQIKTQDGCVKYIQIDGIIHCDKFGTPVRMVGSVLDITKRKISELELTQNKHWLQQIKDTLPIAISVSNSQGVILDCNPYGAALFGYTAPEEAIGRLAFEHYADTEDRTRLTETLKSGIVTDHHVLLKRLDGAFFWGAVSASMIIENNEERIFVAIKDITLEKRIKNALKESERRYRSLFELNPNAVFVETIAGEILDCNNRACDMYGYTKDEFMNLNVRDLIPKEIAAQFDEIITDLMENGGFQIQATQIRKDGSTFTAEINTSLFYIEETPNVTVTVTALDVP